MSQQIKIPETNFVRDIHSKAILNTDKKALNEYLMKKEIAKKQNSDNEETKYRLLQIEKDMQEIKDLILAMRK